MTTSGTTTQTANTAQVTQMALEQLNAIEEGQVISNDQKQSARRLLNALFAEYQARGLRLWKASRTTQLLAVGTAAYALGQGVLDVLADELMIRSAATSQDYACRLLTREEYQRIPNKTQAGTPRLVLVEKNAALSAASHAFAGNLTLTLWPVPDTADTLVFTQVRRIEDASADTDDLDFPTKWLMTLVYGLAYELSFQHGLSPSRQAAVKQRRDEALQIAMRDDNERGGIRIGLDLSMY